MRRVLLFAATLLTIVSCSDTNTADEQEYTGREIAYDLYQASDFPISGTVTFKERTDKSVEILVSLSGTEGGVYHPVHLHSASISTPDAEIAVLLDDLYGKTGVSKSVITKLADESDFTFDQVANYYGSIKVHLSSFGEGKDVVLAGGNIGSAVQSNSTGRVSIAICKSE